jgi:hypothetical protein
MKKVFNNSELAHKFAEQTQYEGRNSNGSFFFDTFTIYSYGRHFPIAKIVTNKRGVEALLFTFRTYSNTTSKQISITKAATRQYKRIYCYNPEMSHADNFKAWLNLAEIQAEKLQKAKKPEIYINELGYLSNQVNEYADFYDIEIPDILKMVLSIKDKKENLEYLAKRAEIIKANQVKKRKEDKKEFKEQITKWFNCETQRVYAKYKFDFLRVNNDRVETTQAVQIPIEIAKRLHNKIKTNNLKVGEQILNYKVDQVDNIIKIGCHAFTRKYLLHFGSKLA